MADKLDAPDLAWDLNPEASKEKQQQVVKELDYQSICIESHQLLKSGKFGEVLHFTEPHLQVPNERFLHTFWDGLMANRARALFALGREDEARELMTRMHRHDGKELLAEYWQRVLQGSFEMVPDYQVLLDKTELTLDIVKMAQEAGVVSWHFEYPRSTASFHFQPQQVSWRVDFKCERSTNGVALITWAQVLPATIQGLRHKAVMALDFGEPSDAAEHFLAACEECERWGLMEYAARFYRQARSVDESIPVQSSLEQVPLTEFSEYLNRSLQT